MTAIETRMPSNKPGVPAVPARSIEQGDVETGHGEAPARSDSGATVDEIEKTPSQGVGPSGLTLSLWLFGAIAALLVLGGLAGGGYWLLHASATDSPAAAQSVTAQSSGSRLGLSADPDQKQKQNQNCYDQFRVCLTNDAELKFVTGSYEDEDGEYVDEYSCKKCREQKSTCTGLTDAGLTDAGVTDAEFSNYFAVTNEGEENEKCLCLGPPPALLLGGRGTPVAGQGQVHQDLVHFIGKGSACPNPRRSR